MLKGRKLDFGSRHVLAAAVALASILLAWDIVHLAWQKAYALDEFLYVHRAWRILEYGLAAEISRGHPFVSSLLNTPFVLIGGDDPANMIFVRLATLLWFGLTLLALVTLSIRINEQPRRWVAGATVLLAMTSSTFVWHATEVRPDGIAFLLVLGSVLAIQTPRLGAKAAAAAAGLLLAAACLTSVKVIVYGAIFAPVFVHDLWAARKGRTTILRAPWVFASSFAASIALVFGAGLAGGGLASITAGLAQYLDHEHYYPGFSSARFFMPMLWESWPIVALALLGFAFVLLELLRRYRNQSGPDWRWLLVLLFFSTWASFFAQKAAFAYSMLPGLGMAVVFACRGAFALVAWWDTDERRAIGIVLGILFVVIWTWNAHVRYQPRIQNDRQIELQRMIGEMVDPGETVYDMSSTFVYRPGAHRFEFVDNARKIQFEDRLTTEVPEAIVHREAMVFVYERRFHEWTDKPLAGWILDHFQKVNNDIYVWGRKWTRNDTAWTDRFQALKTGSYFVHPADVLERGILRIGDKVVEEPVIQLRKGHHSIEWQPGGSAAPAKIYLIWIPRNGMKSDPDGNYPEYELGRYVLP